MPRVHANSASTQFESDISRISETPFPYLLVVWKQECRPTRKGLLDACSNTCFSVCTQSMS